MSGTIRARCSDDTCGRVWEVAELPMLLATAAMLMRRAACPKCGNRKVYLA